VEQILPLGKRDQKRQLRRASFIKEAASVFLELGYRGATMDEIASRVGVTKIVLYRYFDSKDSLMHAILDDIVERLVEVDQQYRQGWPGYTVAMKRSTDVALEFPYAYRLLIEFASTDPEFTQHYLNFRERVEDRMKAAFAPFGVDPAAAALFAHSLTTYVTNAQSYWLQHGFPDEYELFLGRIAAGGRALFNEWSLQDSGLEHSATSGRTRNKNKVLVNK
jgi:AcrR family transcriptional regulator